MEREKDNRTTARRPDCVTETRMGNTVLVVSGFFKEDAGRNTVLVVSVFFKEDAVSTAADKMMRVLEAESMAGNRPEYTA